MSSEFLGPIIKSLNSPSPVVTSGESNSPSLDIIIELIGPGLPLTKKLPLKI